MIYGNGEILINITARNWWNQFPSPADVRIEALLGYLSNQPYKMSKKKKKKELFKLDEHRERWRKWVGELGRINTRNALEACDGRENQWSKEEICPQRPLIWLAEIHIHNQKSFQPPTLMAKTVEVGLGISPRKQKPELQAPEYWRLLSPNV